MDFRGFFLRKRLSEIFSAKTLFAETQLYASIAPAKPLKFQQMQRRIFLDKSGLVYEDPVLERIVARSTKLLPGLVELIKNLAAPAFELEGVTRHKKVNKFYVVPLSFVGPRNLFPQPRVMDYFILKPSEWVEHYEKRCSSIFHPPTITSFKKEDVDDIIQFGKFYKGFRPIRTRCFIQLKLNGPALRLRRLSCRRKNMRRMSSSASSSDKSTSSFWKLVMKRGAAASKAS